MKPQWAITFIEKHQATLETLISHLRQDRGSRDLLSCGHVLYFTAITLSVTAVPRKRCFKEPIKMGSV